MKLFLVLMFMPAISFADFITAYPSTCTNDPIVGGLVDWQNPGNAEIEDGNVATSSNAVSNLLKCTQYGFILSPTIIVDGIKLEVKKDTDLGKLVVDNSVRLYKAGTLSDIDVYTCPADTGLVNTNDMIMTFKNPQEGLDITLVYGVLTEISAALDYPDFYTRGAIAAIEDCLVVNSSFVRVAQVINI